MSTRFLSNDALWLEMQERVKKAKRVCQISQCIEKFAPVLDKSSPRSQPITNNDIADEILRIWTASGKVRRQ